ncbi:MAG: phosphopantetheine-binding protein [Acidimicrobiia bacterium]|nr:phosphopantetheine-binding protein [Acidimicrobiia bacterium]MDH4306683.1 phosphopantetheine-binding protein [Acidimicrobiia bacterium]MDH5295157.1 phosphopantetheine-binding protein [Acidimicrobiia bacterium]
MRKRPALGGRVDRGIVELPVAVEAKIRMFLVEVLPDADWSQVTDADDLMSSGLLDSLAIHEVVGFLEDEFGLLFTDGDLSVENFRSIAAMATIVRDKGRR